MRKRVILLALICSGLAKASSFKINYKNLNTLGGLVCSLDEKISTSNNSYIHNIDITQNKSANITQIEVSGNCNSEIDTKTKTVISTGNQFTIEFTSKQNNQITTQLGLNTLTIQFKKGKPQWIKVSNPFSNKRNVINLKRAVWAKSNSIFSINKDNKIKILKQKRVIASESQANLNFAQMRQFNIWNFNSFACESKENLTQEQCQELADLI